MAFVKEMRDKLLIDGGGSIWFCENNQNLWVLSTRNRLDRVHPLDVGTLGVSEFIIGPACLAQW